MTSATFLVLALAGLALAVPTATAAKVLQEFSRRELQRYCQRRNRLDLFGEILDHYETVLIGAETLQTLGAVMLLIAGTLWWHAHATSSGAFTTYQFVVGAFMGILVLLAATTWIPWAVVQLWDTPFLFHTWRILRLSTSLLWPLTLGVSVVDAFMRRLADRPEEQETDEEAFEDEIRSIVTEGLHDGLLEEDARQMIEGVIELADQDVSAIMTSRSNIDALDIKLTWAEACKFIVDTGRTRLPVYDGTLDQIIGVLYAKDLLREMATTDGNPSGEIRDLVRKPWSVPTTKPLDEMLQEFQHTRSHLAVVVDEYGSVAGVVTIEDVLEEIVGEIVDESDKDADEAINQISSNSLEVLGTAHIDLVNDRFGLELPEPDDCGTVAGLLIRQLGRIPRPGETLDLNGTQITVLEGSRRRVERLRIDFSL